MFQDLLDPIHHFLDEVSGTSIDWVYDTLGVKIVFAIELRDNGTYGFLLPENQIKPTAEEVWVGIKAILEKHYESEVKIGESISKCHTLHTFSLILIMPILTIALKALVMIWY